jgi:hypothetical protein
VYTNFAAVKKLVAKIRAPRGERLLQ